MIIFSIVFILIGAIAGRMDGGGIVSTKEWVERLLVIGPVIAVCAVFAGWWSVLAAAGVAGIATGHGQYFLKMTMKGIKPEFFDFILLPFFGRDPRTKEEFYMKPCVLSDQQIKHSLHLDVQDYGVDRLYWRCVAGMFVTGALFGLPAAALLIASGHLIGSVFLLTGFAKAFAYMFAWRFFKNTEVAEYTNGALRNTICLIALAWGL